LLSKNVRLPTVFMGISHLLRKGILLVFTPPKYQLRQVFCQKQPSTIKIKANFLFQHLPNNKQKNKTHNLWRFNNLLEINIKIYRFTNRYAKYTVTQTTLNHFWLKNNIDFYFLYHFWFYLRIKTVSNSG